MPHKYPIIPCQLTNKMVSDVAPSKHQRVSDGLAGGMLDTIVLDDAATPHLWAFNRSLAPFTKL